MKAACLALLCSFVLLTGCGSYHQVQVDSLRAPEAASGPCLLVAGETGMPDDELIFQEVCRLLTPALIDAGYPPVKDPSALMLTRLSFWQEEPETVYYTSYESRYKPITRKGKTEHILVEEPVLESYTNYTAILLLECHVRSHKGTLGPQLWRTKVRVIGPVNDFRSLVSSAALALQGGVLASQSQGQRYFEVSVNDKGERSVKEK
ncbi:MAG: hypothetical protein IJD16_00640 [Desulfovibrio sp.]|nr:hypothetical protein [Desulfovibrio sp.]